MERGAVAPQLKMRKYHFHAAKKVSISSFEGSCLTYVNDGDLVHFWKRIHRVAKGAGTVSEE
jgi:hypothetical protein